MVSVSNISNIGASTTTAVGSQKSLKDFLGKISKFGIQIRSRYEVNFSGLSDTTFFVTSISTPGVKQNFGSLYFDGKLVEIPINNEYDHDFSMTILNDGSGYIYSAMVNFVANDFGSSLSRSGYTMTIKEIGDNKNYKGAVIKLNGVRIKSCGGLNFDSSDSGISTFEIGCSAIDFSVTPSAESKVGKAAVLVGALKGLV